MFYLSLLCVTTVPCSFSIIGLVNQRLSMYAGGINVVCASECVSYSCQLVTWLAKLRMFRMWGQYFLATDERSMKIQGLKFLVMATVSMLVLVTGVWNRGRAGLWVKIGQQVWTFWVGGALRPCTCSYLIGSGTYRLWNSPERFELDRDLGVDS